MIKLVLMIYYMDLCFAHGNDAAIQIAVSIAGSVENFANLMNQKSEELGLTNSHFITPHGLDKEKHYTTAYELALIADYALDIEKFAEVVNTKTYTVNINGHNKIITNTNELLGYLNGVNGVKTGFTNGAGRCLVTSINRNGFNIITIVLGADTKKFRTKDSISLIEYTYSNYESVNLEELINEKYKEWYSINKKRINVYKAKNNNIEIKLNDCKYKNYPIKKDKLKDINIEIKNVKIDFEAPVKEGQKLAILVLYINNEEIMNTDIIIDNYIERKDIKFYFRQILNCFI